MVGVEEQDEFEATAKMISSFLPFSSFRSSAPFANSTVLVLAGSNDSYCRNESFFVPLFHYQSFVNLMREWTTYPRFDVVEVSSSSLKTLQMRNS
jgi:hypothetical protein